LLLIDEAINHESLPPSARRRAGPSGARRPAAAGRPSSTIPLGRRHLLATSASFGSAASAFGHFSLVFPAVPTACALAQTTSLVMACPCLPRSAEWPPARGCRRVKGRAR
jgi:hypothetical protein